MAKSEVAMVSRFLPDAWLAESLGRPVFRLVTGALGGLSGALGIEMSRLSGRDDALFYAKLPTSDVQMCIALGSVGFAVIDTAITLSRGAGVVSASKGIGVAIARRDQYEVIPKIAERCFRWSRFHLDPKIPPNLANSIKRRWLESYVQGTRGSALYAAEIDGVVAGFLAVIESTVDSRPVAIIDLLGVTSEYQGRGVGTALVQSFTRDWQGRVSELRVGTQAANVASLRLYESCGFRVVESSYVLHAHYHHGEMQR